MIHFSNDEAANGSVKETAAECRFLVSVAIRFIFDFGFISVSPTF